MTASAPNADPGDDRSAGDGRGGPGPWAGTTGRQDGAGPGAPPLSGFSLVKDATRYDLPIEACLRSALRVCDEVVVNVGASDDDTLERVRAVDHPDLRVLPTEWPFDPAEAEPPPRDPRTLKVRISDAVERWTGRRLLEHRNYRLVE